MIDNQIKGIDAPKLRIILISSIILMVVIGTGLFLLFRERLVAFATDVQSADIAAMTSNSDIEQLQKVKKTLEDDKVAVTRTAKIVADSQSYQYQDQIISDLMKYAQKAGIEITSFTFNAGAAANGDAAPAPAPESTASEPESTVSDPESSASAPGLKTTTVGVSIESPVNYKDVMNFIHFVEVNLTKMQITGIALAKATSSDNDNQVSISPLTIEVYTK